MLYYFLSCSRCQVGAAHCFSQGDDPSRYTITCGEHSLQKQDTYEVNLQVIRIQLEILVDIVYWYKNKTQTSHN